MILYKTARGPVFGRDGKYYAAPEPDWDRLFNAEGLYARLAGHAASAGPLDGFDPGREALAPVGSQEVWAAGVTYLRSKAARVEESEGAGGGDFYDRVYAAERPEIFFKATPQRVVGQGGAMHLRSDSEWVVPEPELTLAVNAAGRVVGYTVGNDLSCRDIEGENPLYLPQAKVFKNCAALGPGVWVSDDPIPAETEIRIAILRDGAEAFGGATSLGHMKRKLPELVEFLFRDNTFPQGCFLMTGTGVVPPGGFTLRPGDEMRITIEPIGTLVNTIAGGPGASSHPA